MTHLERLAKSLELDIANNREVDEIMYFDKIIEMQMLGYPDEVIKLAKKLKRNELIQFALYATDIPHGVATLQILARDQPSKPKRKK